MTRQERGPGAYEVVMGVDASLTATGLARILAPGSWNEGPAATTVVRSTGKRSDTVEQRSSRIHAISSSVGAQVPSGALVVLEGPSYSSRGGSAWDRAGLWHAIVRSFLLLDCSIAVVAPQTRAKWATGKGNADKAAVAAVAARLCPDADLGSSDAVDALCLALMGTHALGWRPDLDTAYRSEALLKPEWPAKVAAHLLRPYETPAKEAADA